MGDGLRQVEGSPPTCGMSTAPSATSLAAGSYAPCGPQRAVNRRLQWAGLARYPDAASGSRFLAGERLGSGATATFLARGQHEQRAHGQQNRQPGQRTSNPPVESSITPAKPGPAKPPSFRTAAISSMSAAAAVPLRNAVGSAQKDARRLTGSHCAGPRCDDFGGPQRSLLAALPHDHWEV